MNNPADELASLLEAHTSEALDEVHTSYPGRIQSYDIRQQRASVQPLVRRGFFLQNDDRATELLPIVNNVPIEFLGGGDYALTFPIVPGMTCRLEVMSCSLDKFKSVGGEVDPGDDRRFHLTDSVAVVGLRDFAHALSGLPMDAWVIAAPAGARILLGSVLATQRAILGDAFRAGLDTLLDVLFAYATDPTTPATQASLTDAITAFKALWATMLAQKVRIE